MTHAIAIVGMACQYPDARSPMELWENALAQRRAFRRMPSRRLRLEDYLSPDRKSPDRIYSSEAAVIEGYEFDRVKFRVAGSTFRSADLAHWLALDVAAQALADAGYAEGEGLPRETAGVFLGNTLTGEFSRASLMRLRWPFVRRTVEAALAREGWTPEQRMAFITRLETNYKEPFPATGEESLAGGLSNTIAGRICNYFDLKGGGYTVDGACAASLLAVATGCSALVTGDLDVAIAGGVDLSMDPFELVGFAKTGALAAEKMRVYDAQSAGFWPGEGCGFVVLMRYEDAVAECRRIYSVIRGWGISSDGYGGITRPEVEGQLLALRRAYKKAGYGIETVTYFEGHGTGTSVGDATELKALSRARREADNSAPPAVISSIKANIGHTKAAAGVAGLIKATMALHTQILPPTTGCEQPHEEFGGDRPALRVLAKGEPWPVDGPLRASVSAMGFGGINAHLTLEGALRERRATVSLRERAILSSSQDAELLLVKADSREDLLAQVGHLSAYAANLSRSELADLAAQLGKGLSGNSGAESAPFRAAIVVSTPAELRDRLQVLSSWIAEGIESRLSFSAGVFLSSGEATARIGFLFPGQGSPSYTDGGALLQRFEFVRDLYDKANLPKGRDAIATDIAQPAITTASMAGLRVLARLGIEAEVAVGHSLGEITALHWAGAINEDALLRIATARGKAMGDLNGVRGAMASIRAGSKQVEALLNGDRIVIAGINSPSQTVISGEAASVAAFITRAKAQGVGAVLLPVSHAFHSHLVAAAAPVLAEHLDLETFGPLQRDLVSTVTGSRLDPHEDLSSLLCRQIISPVRFTDAVSDAVKGIDLLIEVGPGQVLSGLVSQFADLPVVSIDAGGPSLKGLLGAVGACFAIGVGVKHQELFEGRLARPFNLDWNPRFFTNPCELAPVPEDGIEFIEPLLDGSQEQSEQQEVDIASPLATVTDSVMDVVRNVIAERVELPPSSLKDDNRLLADLHLNSITVSQLVAEAARRLGLQPPVAPTDYSNVTIAEVGKALEELANTSGGISEDERQPSGVDSWIRAFTIERVERPLSANHLVGGQGNWRIISSSDHPLASELEEQFRRVEGDGIVLCLPPEPDEEVVGLLLESARAVMGEAKPARFILVQHGGSAAAFARTLHLEANAITTCVINLPYDHPNAVEWIVAEARSAEGYVEAHYDGDGKRSVPVLRLLPEAQGEDELALGPDDVLLVTGGGKGIAAECALDLALATGARLALLGRSQPSEDVELANNLGRIAALGIEFRYFAADVCDSDAVKRAVEQAEQELGAVTAFLHGAGVNLPKLIIDLYEKSFRATIAPKIQGARNVLSVLDPERLKLFITFGSLIARAGMRGEADYAVANEWLTHLTESWQREHSHCRCLAVEWSVWSGVGMGQRLGRVDALMRQGITPIPPDEGIMILRRLLGRKTTPVSVIVTGRFGDAPTLKMDQADLPLLRFLEQTRAYYPGIELIVEAELSADSDPYLDDHVFEREKIFPGVMGLEAMAQAAMALAGTDNPPSFEGIEFNRPIVVPDGSTVVIRVAALTRQADMVEVVIRSNETSFQVDHFRALCHFGKHAQPSDLQPLVLPEYESKAAAIAINPERDLYGGILFHKGRFQRLLGYRWLKAKECIAEIGPDGTTRWFGQYLPARLVLGDPGARDAAIHSVQACIPHATLLPIRVDRLEQCAELPTTPLFVSAVERNRDGDNFTYDLEITGIDGSLKGRWLGLQLRLVGHKAGRDMWIAPLLANYLERRIDELAPDAGVSIVVNEDAGLDRQSRSNRAIQRAAVTSAPVYRRPDGKPEIASDYKKEVSASHAGDLTIAVAGSASIGCDIEPVVSRPANIWLDLLGSESFTLAGLIAREAKEDQAVAATRVWAATEALKKAGAMLDAPLSLASCDGEGWVNLSSGTLTAFTYAAQVRGIREHMIIAVAIRSNHAAAMRSHTDASFNRFMSSTSS